MRITAALVLVGLALVAVPALADNSREIVNPAEPYVSNPASAPGEWRKPLVVLYDNGPLVNSPGTGAGGADESQLQTALGMNSLGAGHQFSLGYWVADDFTVPAGGWQVDTITFFAYQTNSTTTSTITGVYVQIFNGDPSAGGTVVWGDTTTNRMASTGWSNIYRVTDTTSGATNRPVMASVATIGTTLTPGTYWVAWSTDGSLTSGPWAPPVTITGQTTTGNAVQLTTAWAALTDTGTATPQGLPFVIDGTAVPVELQSFQVE